MDKKLGFLHFASNSTTFQSLSTGFKNCRPPLHVDYHRIILDEVALEGLDGITLPILKYRLKNRKNENYQPDLPQKFIIAVLEAFLKSGEIEVFHLKKPRKFQKPLVRPKDKESSDGDEDQENDDKDEDIIDPYPFEVVTNDKVKGSCVEFQCRQRLNEVPERFDEHEVVFVASQKQREMALLGQLYDPLIMPNVQPLTYAILERIGRSRYDGDCTLGNVSLKLCKLSAKDLFYHRKSLLKHGLITKQSYAVRVKDQNLFGLLFHLPRFYVEYRPKWQQNIYNIVKFLKTKPSGIGSYSEIKEVIGDSDYANVKKFFKLPQLLRFVTLNLNMNYSDYFPEADAKACKSKNGQEKRVRVMQLIDPNMDPEDVFCDKKDLEDDPDGDPMDVDDNEQGASTIGQQESYLRASYQTVDEAGPEGISGLAFMRKLKMTKYDARSCLKLLERRQLVDLYMKDYKRQKTCFYVAKRFKNQMAMRQKCPIARDKSNAKLPVTSRRQNVITEKTLKRRKMVLDFVNGLVVVDDQSKIFRHVVSEEQNAADNESYGTMDRKSFKKILMGMASDGEIKIYRRVIGIGKKSKELNFVCARHILENDPMVLACIEQHKMKLNFLPVHEQEEDEEKEQKPNDNSITQSLAQLKQMIDNSPSKRPSSSTEKVVFNKSYGKANGVKPKFVRARELHKFLFYLSRDYSGSTEATAEELIKSTRKQGLSVSKDVESDLKKCQIFQKHLSWQTFIPPLPTHTGWSAKGWILICDALLRMPLSLFLQLVCLNYKLEGGDQFTGHPIRKHFLVKNLPNDFRKQLIHGRKYIFSIYEDIQKLAYMGLIQMGPGRKEKDQGFVYVNTKAKLLDTRTSAKGYNTVEEKEYLEMNYEFRNMEDLDRYWHDLYEISIATPLGQTLGMDGKEVLIEDPKKKAALLKALEVRQANQVQDLDQGQTPGDQKGAAGQDSCMYTHVKRNWVWVQSDKPLTKMTKFNEKIKTSETPIKRGTKRKHSADDDSARLSGAPFPVPVKPPSKVRIVKEREKQKRKPYYDEIDKEAMKLMIGQRVDWSSEEDTLLLMSRVAGGYLCQYAIGAHSQMVPYTLVRDLLHKQLPEVSCNKTSRACQRRINYMIRNPDTIKNVSLFLSEIKSNSEILQRFPVPPRGELSREENDKRLRKDYPPLMECLLKMFKDKSNNASTQEKIPADIDELHSKFDIKFPQEDFRKDYNHKEPTCLDDIKASVIWSAVLSSLCCKEDKTNWAFHLFKIYQQYEDNLLKKVFITLRRSKMISVKKKAKKQTPLEDDNLPLNAGPYQLSVTFLHKFLSRIQPDLYPSIKKFYLGKLNGKSTLQECNGLGPEGPGGAACMSTFLSHFKMQIQVPEQVIVMDPNLVNANENYAAMVEKYKDICSKTYTVPPINAQVLKGNSGKKDTKKSGKKSIKKDQQVQDNDREDQDIVFQKEAPEKGDIIAARSGSRLALYIKEASQSEYNVQHTYDYFVVASCKVSVQLPPDETSNHPNTIEYGPCILRQIDKEESDSELFQFIDSKEKLGATISDLLSQFSAKSQLQTEIQDLMDQHRIFRVGICQSRFVSGRHSAPWFLHSFDIKRKDREKCDNKHELSDSKINWESVEMMDIQIRPWVKINGLLHKKIQDFLLISINNYVLTHPGAKLDKIAKHFQPALQPFATRELIELLAKLKCVQLFKIEKTRPSLFSKPESLEHQEPAGILDEAHEIIVEPEKDAMLKLALATNHTTKIFECPCHCE